MIAKLQFSIIQSAWLLALLIITSALPARAQFNDEFYGDDSVWQEGLFKFDYSEDLGGYIVLPKKGDGQPWDSDNSPYLLEVPSIRITDGKPVVALSGFSSLKNLTDILFPTDCHVKYICDNCFQYCTFIGDSEPITLPETVETIGDYAFYGCTRLRSINLSSNLKRIGISAFEKCSSLESITLPKSLKVIREYAFRNCANFDNWGNFIGGGLQSVVFEDEVDFYTNGVFGFYNNVFWGCTNLSSVKLPNNTPGRFIIPMGTFGYCSSLKSIVFPENTRRIEQMAFYRSGLESLDLTNIKLEEGPLYLQGYYTFAACENLKTITANGKVQFDGLYTFQDCTALETVTFTGSGDDYTIMNPDIFKRCSNLKSVEFYHLKGNGQDNDMDSVFTDCTSLERVTSTCPPEISKIGYSCFDGCKKLKTLSLPQTKFLINETAFRGCTALESFDFTNVTSIGKGSFSGCTGLTSLDFTDLTSIDTEAFKGCTALTSVSFNSSSETSFASSIGAKAFTGCTALESLNFNSSSYDPPTVASEDAFDASHYNTTKVNMPGDRYRDFAGDAIWQKFDKLKRPEMYAYKPVAGGYSIRKGDYALEEDFMGIVEVPATYNSQDVVAIEEGAYQDLPYLDGVILPEGLTSIGADAFADCISLSKVINKRKEPLTEDVCPNTAFGSDTYSGTLTVPFGSLDAYKNTAPWSKFTTIEQGFGERVLSAPTASHEQGALDQPFDLTLTNPNKVGSIYYYIVNEGDGASDIRTVETYSNPIKISNTCKVVAYISDGTICCDPVSWEYTAEKQTVTTNAELLSMEAGKLYEVNVVLEGVKANGGVLYARTSEASAAPSNPAESHTAFESYEDGNKLDEYNQRDWVAIEGLTSEYEGFEVGSFIARYDGVKLTNVASAPAVGAAVDVTNINTFGVANVFYGNYENTETLGMADDYRPFFVKAKVNEVANYVGAVKAVDGGFELWGLGVCGKLNEKGLEIDTNGKDITASTEDRQIEGVLVADAEANGGVKLVALAEPTTPTGVEALKADGKAAIYGTEGAVVVAGADGKVTIFDAMGRMVKSVSAEGAATVEMPAGYYIVRTAGTAKAVIVK